MPTWSDIQEWTFSSLQPVVDDLVYYRQQAARVSASMKHPASTAGGPQAVPVIAEAILSMTEPTFAMSDALSWELLA